MRKKTSWTNANTLNHVSKQNNNFASKLANKKEIEQNQKARWNGANVYVHRVTDKLIWYSMSRLSLALSRTMQ